MECSKAKIKYKKNHYIENKDKYSLWARLNYLRKKGNLIIKKECEKCGNKKRLIMHHEDYKKPFEIMVLCRKCHHKLHH